jgi:hypothetical protein
VSGEAETTGQDDSSKKSSELSSDKKGKQPLNKKSYCFVKSSEKSANLSAKDI